MVDEEQDTNEETGEEGSILDAFETEESGTGNTVEGVTGIPEDPGEDPEENPFEEERTEEVPDTLLDGTEGRSTFSTEEEETETPPYSPPKMATTDVLGKGPHKLNKTLILAVILGIFSLFIIFTLFISPLPGKIKQEKTKKPAASTAKPVDYSVLVSRERDEGPLNGEEAVDDYDYIFDTLPPVDPPAVRDRQVEREPPVTGGMSGSGKVSERPDTKGDRLQSKNISGIKGISPTRRQYAAPSGTGLEEEGQIGVPANSYARFGMPEKDDYTAQMLSAYRAAPAVGGGNGYQNQNDQSGKMTFYQEGRENAGNGVWLGPAAIWQGTIFEAVLTSGINTDLPGEATAIISRNVYSSLDGRYLLIPQNSRLFGTYNSSISYSQSRVQVGWHTLIRPDGYAVNLGNMAATDSQGAAGLPGFINDHPFQYLKALGLMSAFNIVSGEFNAAAGSSSNQYVQTLMADSQSVVRTLGSKIIDRAMDVQPTITIKAGLAINIVANSTLSLPPITPWDVTMPYRR